MPKRNLKVPSKEIHVQVSAMNSEFESELKKTFGPFDSGSGFGARDLYISLNSKTAPDAQRIIATMAQKYNLKVSLEEDDSEYSGEF